MAIVRLCPALLLLAAGAAWPAGYLLLDDEEIRAARAKAERYTWARATLDGLLRRAEEALRRPVELPARGGQWPHWYSCSQDGVRLQTISPTEHQCPACKRIYRGDPYDAVVVYGVHSQYSRAVRELGLAYRFTGRAEFAAKAREILLGYADRYRTYPLHDRFGEPKIGGGRVMAQTLDESVWLIPVVFGYSLIRDTLADADRGRIEEELLRPAAQVIREHRMGIHNIQCWKNSAVGLVGFAIGDQALVGEAIDDAERGFRVQIEKGVTAEGLWWEGSLGYHHYTMDALWPLVEAARRAGVELDSPRYQALYDAPIALALPNGDPPGFNDSAGPNLRAYAPLYELAYARWRKPEHGRVAALGGRSSIEALLYGVDELPQGPATPKHSVLLADAGFAVLRSPQMTAAVRFGRHGGGHGHPDKLNLVTFGLGRPGGIDPGSINYGVPLQQEWYRTTIAHNTVSVDGELQKNVDGRLLDWAVKDGSTRLEALAEGAYDGVVLRRTLTLDDTELRDRFECSAEKPHTYDWAFHVPGKLSTGVPLEPMTGALSEANGYQHIRSLSHGRADGDWWAHFDLDGARLVLRVKGEPGTEIFTGEAPGRNPEERVPVLIIRRKAARTVFDVTHRFEFPAEGKTGR